MATDYTGSPSATQSPSPAPGAGVAPILRLPQDGVDARTAASLYQGFKTLADFVAWLTANGISTLKSNTIQAPSPATDAPLLRFKDVGGNTRTLFDHNGYRMGRNCDLREPWFVPFTTYNTVASNASFSASYPVWLSTIVTGGTLQHQGVAYLTDGPCGNYISLISNSGGGSNQINTQSLAVMMPWSVAVFETEITMGTNSDATSTSRAEIGFNGTAYFKISNAALGTAVWTCVATALPGSGTTTTTTSTVVYSASGTYPAPKQRLRVEMHGPLSLLSPMTTGVDSGGSATTVSTTNGSATVTSAAAAFVAGLAGTRIRINSVDYTVATVVDTTHITVTPTPTTTASGLSFTMSYGGARFFVDETLIATVAAGFHSYPNISLFAKEIRTAGAGPSMCLGQMTAAWNRYQSLPDL